MAACSFPALLLHSEATLSVREFTNLDGEQRHSRACSIEFFGAQERSRRGILRAQHSELLSEIAG
jgi:hypothetical protein